MPEGDRAGTAREPAPGAPIVGPLTARLALAFLAVAMGALALLSALMLVAATRDVADLARRQQDQTAGEVASEAAAAYAAARGWSAADLHAPAALARLGGGTVVVLDQSGNPVDGTALPTKPQRLVRHDVVVDGRRLGTVLVAFSNAGLPGADRRLRNALVGTVAAGAGLAALLALGASVVVSRRITRPVVAPTQTPQAAQAGDRTARRGTTTATAEFVGPAQFAVR